MKYLVRYFFLLFSTVISSQSLDIYGPKNFSEILENGFSKNWTPSAIPTIENLRYIILMEESSQKTVGLDATDISKLNMQEMASVNNSTTGSLLRSIFQVVDVNSNSTDALNGKYVVRPLLHTYYSWNTKNETELIVSDAGTYYTDASAGYLVFEFEGTTSSIKLRAVAQFNYNTSSESFEENTAWTTKWVMTSGSQLSLTNDANEAASFLMAEPFDLIDFSLSEGSDFNPKATEWQDNAFADYPDEVWAYEESALFGDQFLMEVDETYQVQFGNSDAANDAAIDALDQIETELIADGESLRYDKSVYLEFRDNLLSRTFAATDMYNAVLGENTVSYVYFTNAADDGGVRHPFMVIASHNASDGPNFLIDVARPPGDGEGGMYEDQSVTRNAILEVKLVKIPLKDYGLITNLTDNDLSRDGTLAEDVGLTSEDFDVYNYASRASSGIAIDGVVIYPSYNNNLRFAAADAEITSTGIHVGRGMGLHYHADGNSFSGNELNLYNTADYNGNNHPPLVGFAYDGLALFGQYDAAFAVMEGFEIALDEFGGHDHSELGYHYHAFAEEVTIEDDMAGTIGPFTQHFLLVGAWKGDINEIPGIFDVSTAQLKDVENGRFAGAAYEEVESSVLGLKDESDWLVVYPNPTSGSFKVISNKIEKLSIVTLSGKTILSRNVNSGETYSFPQIGMGIFILKGEGVNGTVVRRLIVR